ncbi:MAG: protein kinase [Archangium sp.]
MSAGVETVERAIVFENASGHRRQSAIRCVDIWLSALDEALLQVDLGLRLGGPELFVILRFREDRFSEGTQAAITNAGEHAGGKVWELSDDFRARAEFLSRFEQCGVQRLGLLPDEVLKVLDEVLAQSPERRSEPRLPVIAPATVLVGDKKIEAVVQNVSAGGALLRTLTPPPVLREKVEVEIRLPTGEVTAPATVVNVSEQGVSVQFSSDSKPGVKEKVDALAPPAAKGDGGPERIGPWEVMTLLGTGGTSVVHAARGFEGPRKGDQVALKRLHARRASDAKAVKAFEQEARTLSLLKHANIVKLVDSGVVDGQHYLAMELVEGHDLSQILRRARSRKKKLPIDVACYLVKVLLDALSAVHGVKDETGAPWELVHGDVSPHNVFIAKSGAIKLGDFGTARRSGDARRALKEGRPTYLAPEALMGSHTPSVDLWAAGVTLYELLTLEQPFVGNTLEELTEAIRAKKEVSVRERRDEISGPLEALVRSALEKERTQRPATAKDFASALTVHYHPVRAPKQLTDVVKDLFA